MIQLPSIYASGMVVQRGVPLPLRGRAAAHTDVVAEFAGSTGRARSAADGSFLLHLPPQKPGGPHELRLTAGDDALTLSDVLVGDVWLCSGQSNMEWVLSLTNNAAAEIADSNIDGLRLFHLPRVQSGTPEWDVEARWAKSSPEAVREFSAIGFLFARQIRREIGVPVGMISTSWGGTTAESWTPLEALRSQPLLAPLAALAGETAKYTPPGPHDEPPNTGEGLGWAGQTEVGDWSDMRLPQVWQAVGLNHNGTVFFRREVELTPEQAGSDATLSLGVIDDIDTTYVNGVQVGRIDRETANFWAIRRVYPIPHGLLKPGRNVITVRVFDQWGNGGICGNPADLHLTTGAGQISLVGTWRYRVETPLDLRSAGGGQPIGPCELFNAMIHPLLPFPICGALWYQGESNADRAEQYRTLLPTMISAWRKAWGHTVFPFYIVQLANFHPPAEYPGDSTWAELREAQALAQTALPEVYTISAIDVGDAYDIHPTDKQSVARRLANAALATRYRRDLPWRHPSLKRATFAGNSVHIELADAKGLHVRGEKILGFAVCGKDRVWHWAQATLLSEASPSASSLIEVTSPDVASPVALRYAWHENPPSTLFNAAGLPVLPFRTDSFPGITAGKV